MTTVDKICQAITGKEVFIQMHNYPDPDAIASAYGLQKLLEHRGYRVTLCYQGRIEAYNTARLAEEMAVEMHELKVLNAEGRITEDAEVILVDCQKGNTNLADIIGNIIVCIDHHPVQDNAMRHYRFCDIRPEMGACATMVAGYFCEEGLAYDRCSATLLTYGIRSDTANMTRNVSKQDMEIMARLFDQADYALLNYLDNHSLHQVNLKVYSKAIRNTEIIYNISFSDTGKNVSESLVAGICDFMLRLVEVDISVVYSYRVGGIRLSMRSSDGTVDVGKVVKTALRGLGNGGGHANMAGGFVPLKPGGPQEKEMKEIIRDRIVQVIYPNVEEIESR